MTGQIPPFRSIALSPQEDEEYQALLQRLNQEHPPVSGNGFDFSKIRGDFSDRSAKAVVLHLALIGWSITDLAETLKVSTNAVGHLLTHAIREACPIEDVEILRHWEEMKLDEQARVCYEQYRKSCEDEVIQREVAGKDGEILVLETRKPQSGNPAYQRILLEISKYRADMLGLKEPTRVQVDKREQKLIVTEVIVKTREEVEAAKARGLLK